MKHWMGIVSILLGVLLFAPSVRAADQEEPATPSVDVAEMADDDGPKKKNLGLYVMAGTGSMSADEIETSIETLPTLISVSRLSLDDQTHARAAVGWRLAEGKGDFRLAFHGYKEEEYAYRATGSQSIIPGPLVSAEPIVWWQVEAADGRYTAIKTTPEWVGGCDPFGVPVLDDADCDGLPDADEVRYPSNGPTVVTEIPESLQNQLQTVDVMYGREFGGRRFSSHWWAGIRYFEYTGHLLAGAWLTLSSVGEGYSSGALTRPLILNEETTGMGPTGAWEIDFNFFNKGLVLYAKAQTAFTFNSIESDTGRFLTLVRDDVQGILSSESRLNESRDKSGWQNSIELGGRIVLQNGLQFEAGYSINGYLDVMLIPSNITIPETLLQVPLGSSALYNTRDYVVDGWHASVAFQF